jgi:hypothetical protein
MAYPYEVLLLGTGNLFEMSIIGVCFVFLLDNLLYYFKKMKLRRIPSFIKYKKERKNEL